MQDHGGSQPVDDLNPPREPQLTRDSSARVVTEESVYGNILVSGMIVVSRVHEATSWETFVGVIGTVVVFWSAHVYAGAVAGYRASDVARPSLGAVLRRSLRRSIGFLTSALLPSMILLLGALHAVSDEVAVWAALWLGVVILGYFGYTAASLRRATVIRRIAAALATAGLGVAMIVLEVVIH